jgi:hypothetical protein
VPEDGSEDFEWKGKEARATRRRGREGGHLICCWRRGHSQFCEEILASRVGRKIDCMETTGEREVKVRRWEMQEPDDTDRA